MNVRIQTRTLNRLIEQNKPLLFRILLSGVVLLSGAVLVPRIFSNSSRFGYLLLLYPLLFIVIIFLRWPVIGLIAIILGGMVVPFKGPSGLNAAVVLVALMVGLWWLKMMLEERQVRVFVTRTTIPLFAFILASLLAFAIGQLPWFYYAGQAPLEAQLGGLSIFILSAGAFLLSSHLIRDLRWLQILTWTFVVFGAIYVLGRLVQYAGIDRIFQHGFSAGSMYWTWFIAIIFSQVLINKSLQLRWRVVLGCILVATLYVAVIEGYSWKSGWIPPLIAIATIFGLRYRRFAFALIPFIIIPAINYVNQIIGTDLYSWGTRLDAGIIVLNIVKANPILGLGFANYYWITPLFPIRGYAISFNSHNQYLDILAQTGLLGLLSFLWFLWEVGRLGLKLRERVPEGFAQAYVYGALGGLAGTIVAAALVDWVLPFVYNIGLTGFRASILPWLFLGGLISLQQMYQTKE